MHQIIRNINLALAGAAFLLGALSFTFPPGERFAPEALVDMGVLICWLISAFALKKEDKVWSWVGSLLPTLWIMLSSGRVVFIILKDIRRIKHGEQTGYPDPSTHGIPLIGASIITLGSLLFLVALLSLPTWRGWKNRSAEQPVNGNRR